MWETPVDYNVEFTNFQFGVPAQHREVVPTQAQSVLEKLQGDRYLSIWGGSSNADASQIVRSFIAGTEQSPYNVVLWIQADSALRVTAQYMELASYLRLRASETTGPEIVSRLLAWLYRQKSYLLVFEVSNKITKIDWLEPFIPRGFQLHENRQTGHVVFVSHQQKLHLNHLRVEYSPAAMEQAIKGLALITPPVREAVVPLFKTPSTFSVDTMLMLEGSLANLELNVATKKLDQLSENIKKLESPTSTNITREIGTWALQLAKLSEIEIELVRILSLPMSGQLPVEVLHAWAEVRHHQHELQPAINRLTQAGLCQSLKIQGSGEVIKLISGVFLSVASSLQPEQRIAGVLELLVALAKVWPTINGKAQMPLRAPQFIWADDIRVNQTGLASAPWGRQYYSWLYFTLYLSHSSESAVFTSISNKLNIVVDAAVRGQTETTSLSSLARMELLQKSLEQSKVDGRLVMELLSQAGHFLLGVHGLTKEASRVFNFRLALCQALDTKSPSSYFPTPLTGDELALAHRDMAIVLTSSKRFHDAFEHIDQALQLVTVRNGATHASLAILGAEKGDIFLAQASSGSSSNNSSQLAAARSYYEKGLGALGSGLFRAVGHHRLAIFFDFIGEMANSILNQEKALEIENGELGSYHVAIVHRLDLMGESWRKLNRLSESLRVDSKALQIAKELTDSLDPWFGKHLSIVGIATARLNNTRDRSSELPSRRALKHLDQALTIEVEAAGETHPLVAQRLHDFADLQALLGASDKALVYYRRAYLVEVTLHGFQNPTVLELREKMESLSKRIQEAKPTRQKKSEV